MTDHAASLNLMKYLFSRDVMTQFMRFELTESWNDSAELQKALILLENYCLMLIQSFLSLKEQIIKKDVNEVHAVMFDEHHQRS